MKVQLLFFSSLVIPVELWQEWWHEKYSEDVNSNALPNRVISLMRSTYVDVGARISELNDIRFLYEESPHYEIGYVFAEIIERYKKMVLQVKFLTRQMDLVMYDCVDKVEKIQHLYFEIQHLRNMMHEIYNKYSSDPEFSDLTSATPVKFDVDAFRNAQLSYEEAQAKIRKEMQQKKNALKRKLKGMEKVLGKRIVDKLPDNLNVSSAIYGNLTEEQKNAAIAAYKGKQFAYSRFEIDYGWELEDWE